MRGCGYGEAVVIIMMMMMVNVVGMVVVVVDVVVVKAVLYIQVIVKEVVGWCSSSEKHEHESTEKWLAGQLCL